MAVAFDAVGPSSAGASLASGSSLTWSHTCSGTSRILFVGVAVGAAPDTGISASVTYGGTAMTAVGSPVHSGSGTSGFAQLFALINPATGANTVAVTLTGGAATITAGSVSLTGADQTTGYGTPVSAVDSAIGTTASVALTGTTTGNMVVDVLAQGSGGASTSGQTLRWQHATNSASRAGCGAQSTAAAGGSITMSYTWTAADHWALLAVEVLAAATTATKSGSDSATGTDAASGSAAVAAADTGAGSDTAGVTIPFAGSDAGTGAESYLISIPVPGNETGTGSEAAATTAAASGVDTATGSDTGTVAATTTGADTAAGADTPGPIGLKGTDTASGAETQSSTAAVAGPDVAGGADGGFYDTAFGDLNVSLWAVGSSGALSPLPDFANLSLSPVRNAPGSISVDYPAAGLNYELLHGNVTNDRDVEVEIWLNGSNVGALRGYLTDTSVDDISETKTAQFSGAFLETRMGEDVVRPQVAPLGNDKQELVFTSATAGTIIKTLLDQSHTDGVFTDITYDFTGTADSAGMAWPLVVSTKYSPGATYLQVLDNLVALGLVEWHIGADHVLHAWRAGGRGVDRTAGAHPVILRRGRNLLDSPRKHSVANSATAVLAAGANGIYETAADANAATRRGRKIVSFSSANGLTDTSSVTAFAQSELAVRTPGQMELTHGVGSLKGEPLPGAVYNVGDWVWSDTAGALERLRCAQWSLTIASQQNSVPTGTTTLNDLTADAIAAQAKRLDALASGAAVVGTSTGPNTSTPNPPTGLSATSVAYLDGAVAKASVTVSWTAPTTNVDGTSLNDLAGYTVQFAYASSPTAWQFGGTVNSPVTLSQSFSANPGVTISIRVAAFDYVGNTSAWSTPVSHTTASDVTPPAVTSTPTVTNYLGVLKIAWDGKTSTGADMLAASPDFDHVEVHISAASAFTPSATTYFDRLFAAGTVVYTDGTYGTTYYAKLVAVDRSGNASAASAQASDTPAQVVSADVFAGAIGTAQLADAAITNAKIANLAVNDAKIGDLSVGKLTAGALSATVTLTGSIKTATSGARFEADGAGIRLYDTTGTLRVQLQTSDGSALVTGTYQSALSGTRINILPDGTFRVYGSSGTDYGQIQNASGVIRFTSMQDTVSGFRSFVNFDPTGLQVRYGTPGGSSRSALDCGKTYAVLSGPVTGIRINTSLAPDDGTANRFHFVASTNGLASGDIGNSVLHYQPRTSDSLATIYSPGLSGLLWASGAIGVIGGGPDTGNGPIVASAFNPPSTGTVKTPPVPARFGADRSLTGRGVIDRVDAPSWSYLFEAKRPRHFGPIAEDLQAVDTDLVSTDYAGRLVVDLRDLLGVAWSAIRELSADGRALAARVAALEQPTPPAPAPPITR